MAFHEQDYAARYQRLGDQAEAAYLEQLPHGPAVRFGWKRPPISFGNMPDMLRYMPDFYTADGWLCEVMGCGKDMVLRGLKVKKWLAMSRWFYAELPLRYWLWNSHLKQGVTVTHDEMAALVSRAPVKEFDLGRAGAKEFYEIPWAWLGEVADVGWKRWLNADQRADRSIGAAAGRTRVGGPATAGDVADGGTGP
jgi:hypothetical protein